jgi:ATP-dependent RNA helicase SUPV3L1/SUV3
MALWAVWSELKSLPPLPAPGRVSLAVEADWPQGFLETAGFWRIGAQAVRIDIVDRLARAIHGRRDGRAPFIPDPHWAASAGLSHDGLARLLRALGYKPQLVDGTQHFAWRGSRRFELAGASPIQPEASRDANARAASPFGILADVRFESAGQVPARRSRSR